MIRTKRVYESPSPDDGRRILIDRLWPRGLTKEAARLDEWRRDLAPSPELRTWYGHEIPKFPRFRERYRAELALQRSSLEAVAEAARRGTVTLVYASKDSEHCNAAVVRELLEEMVGTGRPRPGSFPARPRTAQKSR